MTTCYDENEIRKDYKRLTQYLIANKLSISTMESATSGQIASLITDTEGASAIIKGAFITYCNEAKIMQGVPQDIIEKYSVYSEETARAMAQSCQKIYQANIGIGVTGTFGNIDPKNEAVSEVGKVYFAIALNEKTCSYHLEIKPQISRLAYKLAVAKEIYDRLAILLNMNQ